MVLTARLKIFPVIFIVLVLAFSGCSPRSVLKPRPVDKGEDLFAQAEKLYQQGDYDAAIVQYLSFLEKYPRSSMAPAALMKTGRIYELRNDYASAYQAYARILEKYPHTVFAPDAGVEMLAMLFNQGKYPELIQKSAQLPKVSYTRTHIMRISILTGDTFMAMDAPVEAAYTFITAYGMAMTPTERETVTARLKNAVSILNDDDIRMLTMRLKDPKDIELVNTIRQMAQFRSDTIGCMLPLSGAYEVFGNRALKGIELALNRFSVREGIDYKIIVKDTRSDPEVAKKCVLELVEEKAACIIGPIATADSAAAVAQENRIPIIALSQMDGIPETGDYVFRNFITSSMQVKTLVSYAVDKLGARRFAILYPNEKYGLTFMNLFWDEVIKHGGEVVGVESYELDQTDFEAPVKKLVGLYYEVPEDLKLTSDQATGAMIASGEEGQGLQTYENNVSDNREYDDGSVILAVDRDEGEQPETEEPQPIVDFDVLFLPDSPKKAGLIIPQLAYYDVENVILCGTNLWHSDELIGMAGSYAQGAIMTDGFFENSKTLPVRTFIKAFRSAYEEKPGFIEAVAYDSAVMVFTLLAENNFAFRGELKDALTVMPYFDGVTGLTAFNEIGEADKRLYLLKIIRNRFAEIEY